MFAAARRIRKRISLQSNIRLSRRLLGWLTYRYHSDGLLFWHVNLWPDRPPLNTDDTFLTAWEAENSLRMPGDGQLLYPGADGPLPSIRLANVRDGIEDYEWLMLLAQKKPRRVRGDDG